MLKAHCRPGLAFFHNIPLDKNLERQPNHSCPQLVHIEAYFTVPSAQDILTINITHIYMYIN